MADFKQTPAAELKLAFKIFKLVCSQINIIFLTWKITLIMQPTDSLVCIYPFCYPFLIFRNRSQVKATLIRKLEVGNIANINARWQLSFFWTNLYQMYLESQKLKDNQFSTHWPINLPLIAVHFCWSRENRSGCLTLQIPWGVCNHMLKVHPGILMSSVETGGHLAIYESLERGEMDVDSHNTSLCGEPV